MGDQFRRSLAREDIDEKAEEVILHFFPAAPLKRISPLYEVVDGLMNRYKVPIQLNQDLGFSQNGKKILGRFDFKPRQIRIDKFLPHDSPRFRWTLAHEIGHLVLHRNLNPDSIFKNTSHFIDTRKELRFFRTAKWTELQWVEWQANQFASALLLPRYLVHNAVSRTQGQLGIRRPGSIYLDDQPQNMRDYRAILMRVASELNVSRTVLRLRLLHLGVLTDARRSRSGHVYETLKSLFSEDQTS